MRPRTKSIVTHGEYFRHESAYASSSEDESGDEDWMDIALRGASKPSCTSSASSSNPACSPYNLLQYPSSHWLPACHKGRKRRSSSSSSTSTRSTITSWDENDPDLLEFEDEGDEEEDGVDRQHRCSHERRISFKDDVRIFRIPSRESMDADLKKRIWYSTEDYSRMANEL